LEGMDAVSDLFNCLTEATIFLATAIGIVIACVIIGFSISYLVWLVLGALQ
jgi:hypothetical protein